MKKTILLLLIGGFSNVFCFGQRLDTMIYHITEFPAKFIYKNGINTDEACKNYFMENFKMPKELKDIEFKGKIYVEFVIEKDSSINNIKLLHGIDKALDKLVLESVKSMSQWVTGSINGRNVRTYYILQVSTQWLYNNIE
jgi:hypothetical protein